jgi:hypothetical protein
MSKIDALIEQLQIKKRKIDYLGYIKDTLANDQKCVDYVEVQEEVLSKLNPLIDSLMSQIEEGIETPSGVITKEEIGAVRQLLEKVKNREAQVNKNPQAPSVDATKRKEEQQRKKVLATQDKMNFALENRHLANQRVKVLNNENMEIRGLIVGLDAPNVIVRTDSGPTIEVPLEKVVVG